MATRRANGVFYIKRRFKGIGPVYRSLGTKRKTQADALENVLVKLHDRGRLDLVVAFLDGDVAIRELAESFETSSISQLTTDLSERNSPLDEACTEALRLKAPDVTATTLERYTTGLDHFQSFAGALTVRKALAQAKIQAFKSFRLGEGVARETINNDLIAISILTTHALDRGWIDKRPKLKRYKPTIRVNYLEPTQLDTYFAALRAPFRPFFDLLVDTGMRLGEVEALRVADLRIGDQEGRALVEDAKTPEGVRTVFIPPETTEVLLAHIEERGVRGMDLVFNLIRRTTQKEHTRACKLVGIHGYTIHDHRHTFAVRLARAGMPLNLIQSQLGHATIAQVMKYATFNPDYGDVRGYFKKVLETHESGLSGNRSGNTPKKTVTESGMADVP